MRLSRATLAILADLGDHEASHYFLRIALGAKVDVWSFIQEQGECQLVALVSQ